MDNRFSWPWLCKMLCGFALLGHFVAYQLSPPATPILTTPYLLMLTLVVTGGTVTAIHGLLLRGHESSGTLETGRGLYPWIRHPMYLGDALVYLGFATHPLTLTTGALVLAGWFSLLLQARDEDRALSRHHSQVHQRWRARSGLFFNPRVFIPKESPWRRHPEPENRQPPRQSEAP